MSEKDEIIPRYEFRVYAPSFGRELRALRERGACQDIAETTDIYLVTAANDSNNLKLRDEQIDIKQLINVEQELEQWRPVLKRDFPLTSGQIQDEIFPALRVGAPALPAETWTAAQLLEQVMWPHPQVRVARVFKRRYRFAVEGCLAEFDELFINGAAIESMALESEDAAAVSRLRAAVGLDVYANVNYVRAIKRIMGLAPLGDWSWA